MDHLLDKNELENTPRIVDDDLALGIRPSDIPCDSIADDDETAGSLSMKDDENRTSCRTKITPSTDESKTDSESLNGIRLANDILEDDVGEDGTKESAKPRPDKKSGHNRD